MVALDMLDSGAQARPSGLISSLLMVQVGFALRQCMVRMAPTSPPPGLQAHMPLASMSRRKRAVASWFQLKPRGGTCRL